MEQLDWTLILALFLGASLIVRFLLKRFLKAQTFAIISVVRTVKANQILERFSRHGRLIDFVSLGGLVFGLGAIGADYVIGRRTNNKPLRIGFFFLSAALLYAFFSFFFGELFSQNPISKPYSQLIAVVFSFSGFLGFLMLFLAIQALDIIVKLSAGQSACPGVAPIIPGVEIPNVPVFIPLHAWLSILIILVVHEGFHGITALRQGLPLKSAGLLLFGFLPIGAFVEPDDEEMKKADGWKQLKVYSAGPSANLFSIPVFAIVFLLLAFGIMAAVNPWASQIHRQSVEGVKISEVDQNLEFCGYFYESPAFGVLDENAVLLKVNDRNVSMLSDFQKEFVTARGKPLRLTLLDPESKEIVEKTVTPNEVSWYGFRLEEIENEEFEKPAAYEFYVGFAELFNSFFTWLLFLSFAIALFNFLPLPILDGDKIAKIVFPHYLGFLSISREKKEKAIAWFFRIIILSLLAVNALPLFL